MCPALAGGFLTTAPPGKPPFTIFLMSTESVLMGPLSFLILVICLLFFFLVNLARNVSILLIFSTNPLLVLIDLLFSVSLISALIFIISFLLLTLDLLCSFLVS